MLAAILGGIALRTDRLTFGPAHLRHGINAGLRIGEVPDGLSESLRLEHVYNPLVDVYNNTYIS